MTSKPHTWCAMLFKGQRVYIRCDERNEPWLEDGRVDVRYHPEKGKIYRGSPRNIETLATPEAPVKLAEPEVSDQLPLPSATQPSTHSVGNAEVIAYTDGACSGNPGPAGYGAVILRGENRTELSGWLGDGTNNIAELEAIHHALKRIATFDTTIDLYTDSSYSIGVLTKGWKAKANQELIATIQELVRKFENLRFHWVRGHVGIPENERADELARLAVDTRTTQVFESSPSAQGPD